MSSSIYLKTKMEKLSKINFVNIIVARQFLCFLSLEILLVRLMFGFSTLENTNLATRPNCKKLSRIQDCPFMIGFFIDKSES